MKRFKGLFLLLLLGMVASLGRLPVAEAGIFNASEEVTYKEYWIPHKQFTGGCTDDGLPLNPTGSFYSEPNTLAKCPKEMLLEVNDNISGALKAEIYVDLWRNYDAISARLRINGLGTIYKPDRGYDWSRTPWVTQIPLDSFVQGTNKFLFWGEQGKYHIYDVALRVYYDDAHPIIPGGAVQDVTPPTGQLLTIDSLDTGVNPIPANTGGLLMVNEDRVILEAQVGPGAKYVEFHAFYNGYDDDKDGVWHDWHNVSRNNWWPGGQSPQPTGGTLNHIGTKAVPPGGGTVTTTWEMPHVINQSGVRFKIRIVDENGNVREGAGGVTPEYTLARTYPVVYYTMPGFDDYGIHMGGTRADTVAYDFPLPANLDLNQYESAFLVGMYWRRPQFSINGSAKTSIRNSNTGEDWSLGVRTLNKALLKPGINVIEYFYGGSGEGHFIEHPGPMIVLRGTKSYSPDLQGPQVTGRSPSTGSSNVDVFSPVVVTMSDIGGGIDFNSIIMSVNGELVKPVLSGASNNLTITYTPPSNSPYPPNTTIPVTIYACDIFDNCMGVADQFSFTTEPPDIKPPVISNINAVTTDSKATITWLTDEGTDTKLDFGLTTNYELPEVYDAARVTLHSVELTGLQAQTTYNFQITAVDFSGNTTATTNLTFKTKRVPGAIVSDNFSQCTLDTSTWSFVNPRNDSQLALTGLGAQITVPAGVSHDLWKSGLFAPRLMQYVTNQNFGVEVKFDTPVTQRTQSMGLLVQQDNGNWLRFNFQNDGLSGSSLVVVNSNKGNQAVAFSTPVTMGNNSYLRVNRLDSIWNIDYSMDGTNWTFATTITRTLNMTEIGPYVGNGGPNPQFIGHIDYFESKANPLTGEDSPIQLNVIKNGAGTVTRSPDKTSYLCGETVTLTATPATDFTFGGWSGAINSTNPVETITLNKTEEVIATFNNDNFYTMAVNVVSNGNGVGGTVTKNPEQNSYQYGTPVLLTASPTQGWSFMGWSGDWSGTDLTPTVPVTGDMDITATFDEDEYTITTFILTDGFGEGGTITVEPLQETYLYGEIVTLTVNVNPGWSFDGWEENGVVSGTNPILSFPMTENVLAVAKLSQAQYDLGINIIQNGEPENPENVVLKTPDQETYGYGQVVTLTAVAAQGWVFDGWGGVLSGTEPTQVMTMMEDKSVEASFTQEQYTLTVTVDGPGSVNITPQKPYYVYGDVVTLTPVPQSGFDFALWTGDITGTDDPLIIPIDKDINVEAVFVVDTTPIEIVSHAVEVHGLVAVVTWTTDVPGDSRVDYGEDTFYEDGSERKEELVTNHTIQLKNLKPDTRYHYQIISADASGNEVQSEDLTFFTGTSSGLISDDFSSCELRDLWTFVNPLNDSADHGVTGQQVEIFVPAEDNDNVHNIFSNGMEVPRLMQPSNDKDFTVEVKFDSVLTEGGTIQGIVIEQDAQNFIRFDFFLRTYATDPSEVVVYAASFKNLTPGNIKNQVRLSDVQGPLYMRIVRTGHVWEQFYSLDGENWTKSYQFTYEMVVKNVGLFAGNTRYQGVLAPHTAVIDYFFNTAARIEPEDSFYQLDFNYEGSGMVQRNPNKPGYYCGEQVTLTAVGNTGWGFVSWGGDISGTNPTQTITVNDHMNIVARFQVGVERKIMMPIILKP